MNPLTRRRLLAGGLGLLGTSALVACSPQSESTAPAPSGGGTDTAITHVHAITRDTGTGTILLATHEGLFRLKERKLNPVGPVVDLMGFITMDGRYLASGHPGDGTDLPEPVGLVVLTRSVGDAVDRAQAADAGVGSV
ncbi:MAG TPA: hypothetical protein VN520_18895 [Streptomyces sp.]|uniref:hypothetical protein n=1 Tax=Streptomyces sp. TaxID=1931 RepID=UPI002C5DCEEB|nr:hypothetical protein [Streptomyces sp.]HWU08417.1 hypothetical protein [Streptomyces sp.]